MTIENHSLQSFLKDDAIEKDRRQLNLLNDPNYGIVLGFLDKFGPILDLPNYSLQLFEDHLLNYQGKSSSRLIDFHFALLKRLSLAKRAQRDNFDSIITTFAARFDINDSEHLATTGYVQSDVHVKIRTIKNLLESQLDVNQTLRKTLIDKSSCEIKSLPFGRDRFGVSYWLFMDEHCFVRLFRENVDIDRTWTNVAKNRDEFEEFIKLLITDSVVRMKFPDWTIDYEPFSSLPLSNEYEQCYFSTSVNVRETETDDKQLERSRHEIESLNNEIDIPTKEEENGIEPESNNDEKSNLSITRKRGRPKRTQKLSIKEIDISNTKEKEQTRTHSGKKRHFTSEDNSNEKKFKIDEDQSEEDDINLVIRRSSRFRKNLTIESSSETNSQLSDRKTKKRLLKNKKKVSNNRSRRRKTFSTSSSDEQIDYSSDDEYTSDDYSQIDINDPFFEFDEDTTDEQLHPAKTAQISTIITSCYVCSKSDRPEVLLLCDGCNDAYHLECLCPVLFSLPNGDWFCPLCEHKKLSNNLIEKLKELLMNYNKFQTKQAIHASKQYLQRKIKVKEYSSDESITASESENENNEKSMLLISEINENSNLSLSSYMNDNENNISQRGRHRRTRFNMKEIFNNHEEYQENSNSNDDTQIINFNVQLPTKMTRLLHHRHRSLIKSEQKIKSVSTRIYRSSIDSNDTIELNDKLHSPINSNEDSCEIQSVRENFKQTSGILRRWNDVRRRSRIKAMNMKIANETIISDYTDENSNFCLDDTSLSQSNDGIKHEDNTIIHSKKNLIQSTFITPIDGCSLRNGMKKMDGNFDRLTRDIQSAVNESHLLSTTTTATTKTINQQYVKRVQKKFVSPYMVKQSMLSLLSKPSGDVHNIFKSNDSSMSNNILLSSSSSTLLDVTDNQTIEITNT